MNDFFGEAMTGLLQAVAIEKGYIPLEEVEGMPAPTYRYPEATEVDQASVAKNTLLQTVLSNN